MDVKEIGYASVVWFDLAQNRGHGRALVNTVMNLRDPKQAENLLTR
jgi:hypothetical protein